MARKKYYNSRTIYIYDFFNKNDFKVLEKLNITVEDKKNILKVNMMLLNFF